MIRRPPRPTRTDTLFPYTPLFRSRQAARAALLGDRIPEPEPGQAPRQPPLLPAPRRADGAPDPRPAVRAGLHHRRRPPAPGRRGRQAGIGAEQPSSEERRVGEECVSTCKDRRSPPHKKKQKRDIEEAKLYTSIVSDQH